MQHLIDEGHISRQEAAKHPQRNIVTRAVGVTPEVEVDTFTLDLEPGDQVLLCSDGLTGVVEDEAIADELSNGHDPDATVETLIGAANDAGGPDNITVLLLRYEDTDAPAPSETPDDHAGGHTIEIRTRQESGNGDWANRLGAYGSLSRGGAGPQEEEQRDPGRILARATAIVLGLAVIIGLVVVGGQFLLSRSYFVGLDGEQVVIYQGIDVELGPISLARVTERTELGLDEVPAWFHPQLEAGRPAANLNDARRIVRGIPRRDADETDDSADEEPDTAADTAADDDAGGGTADDADDPGTS